MDYRVTLEQCEGGWLASCPDLDGCFAFGETVEEALDSIADTAEMWIQSQMDAGFEIPKPTKTVN